MHASVYSVISSCLVASAYHSSDSNPPQKDVFHSKISIIAFAYFQNSVKYNLYDHCRNFNRIMALIYFYAMNNINTVIS